MCAHTMTIFTAQIVVVLQCAHITIENNDIPALAVRRTAKCGKSAERGNERNVGVCLCVCDKRVSVSMQADCRNEIFPSCNSTSLILLPHQMMTNIRREIWRRRKMTEIISNTNTFIFICLQFFFVVFVSFACALVFNIYLHFIVAVCRVATVFFSSASYFLNREKWREKREKKTLMFRCCLAPMTNEQKFFVLRAVAPTTYLWLVSALMAVPNTNVCTQSTLDSA